MNLMQCVIYILGALQVTFAWEFSLFDNFKFDQNHPNDIPFDTPNFFKREFYDNNMENGVLQRSSSIIDSDNIAEWTPITSNLTAGQQDFYVFSIDTTAASSSFATSYEILIFLSGNICNVQDQPDDVELKIVFAFNDTIANQPSNGESSTFSSGYLEALAVSPIQTSENSNITSLYSNLYVTVEAYNTSTGTPLKTGDYPDLYWEYHLSISENDLVFQWDMRSWLVVLDTDEESALLVTGSSPSSQASSGTNYTISDASLYDIYIYSYNDSLMFDPLLNRSLCAIKNGPYIVSSVNNSAPGNVRLDERKLMIQKIISGGSSSSKEHFYVTGLNSSTRYVAYLTKKVGKSGSLSSAGGILFNKVIFETREDNTCSLIHNLDFCTDVAYSVPTSELYLGNKTALAEAYEHIAESLYANFSKALQLVACDTEKDARYSPIRDCNDCAESYRNWICSVSIPRCTTNTSSYYIHRDKDSNRNTYIDEDIQPLHDYYEILPCIDMCYAIVRDCPSDFKFACPDIASTPELLFNSYNFYNDDLDFVSCNLMGNDTDTVPYPG